MLNHSGRIFVKLKSHGTIHSKKALIMVDHITTAKRKLHFRRHFSSVCCKNKPNTRKIKIPNIQYISLRYRSNNHGDIKLSMQVIKKGSKNNVAVKPHIPFSAREILTRFEQRHIHATPTMGKFPITELNDR